MTRLILFSALLIGSCGYAIARGGAPERIVGAALLAAAVGTGLSLSALPVRFFNVEIGVLVVDVALLVVLVAVALQADRFWPLLLAGLQLDTVGAHLFKLVRPDMIRVAYALSIAGWSYPMLLALAVGVWRHRRRLRAKGQDLDWTAPRPRKAAAIRGPAIGPADVEQWPGEQGGKR
jgi:hypothetical protein